MKINFFLFIVCFITVLRCSSQDNSIKEIDTRVAQMRKELQSYQKIEKLKTDTATKEIYLKDNELKMITITEKIEIIKHIEWFYSNGDLIYTEVNWATKDSHRNLMLEKTYHYKGVMLAWLESENSFVDANSSKFKDFEKSINAYSAKIRNQALE